MIKRCQISIAAFALPVLCLCLLFAIRGIYPFGGISNMAEDMEIQYADLFAWYRRVLMGQAGPEYSFSMSIGMPTAAVLGYYLLSPVNLLALFFTPSSHRMLVICPTVYCPKAYARDIATAGSAPAWKRPRA